MWGEKRFMAKEQARLVQEIHNKFWFLFAQFGAEIIPNTDMGHLALLQCPIVTVAADGLLFRFVHWRDSRQVHIASERLPNEWQELSAVLNVVEPDEIRRHSILSFDDAAGLLRGHLDQLKEIFLPERYPEVKLHLDAANNYDRVISKQAETEINRRLYPDR
jgi:hypothetical protein